jgi:hypothetical protein
MTVQELMDELEQFLSDEPEQEDFKVYFVVGNRQFEVTSLLEGLRLGEYEDDLKTEKYGEGAYLHDEGDYSHLAGVWLFADKPPEKLIKTVKKVRASEC